MALRGNGLTDDVPVDRWQICKFMPPSHVMIEVGVALAGKGGDLAAPQHKAASIVVDFITPEPEAHAEETRVSPERRDDFSPNVVHPMA